MRSNTLTRVSNNPGRSTVMDGYRTLPSTPTRPRCWKRFDPELYD